jgi:hypothetical protein
MNITVRVQGLSRRLADARIAALVEAAQRIVVPTPVAAPAVPPPEPPR